MTKNAAERPNGMNHKSTPDQTWARVTELSADALKAITGGSSANFPPGQFPAGNPAHAPGNSSPDNNGRGNG
jgi:hypothetical protein